MTRFYTEGAKGGDDAQGVKLPDEPGENEFEVFINSEENGVYLSEYSNEEATTNPEPLDVFEIHSAV